MNRRTGSLLIVVGLVVAGGFMLWHRSSMQASVNPVKPGLSAAVPQSGKPAQQAATFNSSLLSKDTPTSLWVIVNKHRPLNPVDYAPQLTTPDVALRLPASDPEMQVSVQMAPALKQLFTAASNDGLHLKVASAYRSYQTQVAVYGAEVKNYGQQTADRESARPGYSEHQTGLAADIEPASRSCEVQDCFADTPEGTWLAANAYTYGFVVRYIKDGEAITGYKYEPWHIRYVGTDLAAEVHRQGNVPLETLFKLGAAPDYQ